MAHAADKALYSARRSGRARARLLDIGDVDSPQLRRFLGKDAYERVAAHIGKLRFEQAAQVLEENPPGNH